jgi:hypothetical protein
MHGPTRRDSPLNTFSLPISPRDEYPGNRPILTGRIRDAVVFNTGVYLLLDQCDADPAFAETPWGNVMRERFDCKPGPVGPYALFLHPKAAARVAGGRLPVPADFIRRAAAVWDDTDSGHLRVCVHDGRPVLMPAHAETCL